MGIKILKDKCTGCKLCLKACPFSAITMSEKGHARARDIIRRHRLAERLFADVLDIADYALARRV